MKKKIVIALALTLAVSAGIAGTTTFVSNAANYRQAKTPDDVVYGTLTEEQLAIINEKFDYGFYAAKYADVKKAFGMDKDMLLLHFIKCGVFEGRLGWPTYDADELGVDLTYLTMIDVQIFAASNLMGTDDFATVNAAVESAESNGVSIISTPSGDYIVATDENNQAIEDASVEYEKVGEIQRDGDNEGVVIVYKTPTGFGAKFETDMHNGAIDMEDVIGFVPVVVMGVEEGNRIIDGEYEGEGYAIDKFETNRGMVIGTECVTYTNNYDIVYYEPDNFDAPHKRMMTNYVNGGYVDNAPVGIDEDADENSTYSVSADAKADENGNAQVTTVIKNDNSNFVYKVTYTFDGTTKSEKAESTQAADAESTQAADAESTETEASNAEATETEAPSTTAESTDAE